MTDKPIPKWAMKLAKSHEDSVSDPRLCGREALARLLVATREAALREAMTVCTQRDAVTTMPCCCVDAVEELLDKEPS